ncbi:serine hydrolase [Porphyrobacter sp. HT-58-2]|uniref:serine hydrolase domain-containing protein n=1 Tax=Porphyrobacter sp. HT-58-2 TaxID=2023229 RepID=UPI000CDC5ABD|nr:serine hydrolase [Porphyrobacter sp. HT-58-2]AUX70206.1 serine hydrolase [Porphyrobacter sp. HT-58-2]
MIRQSIAAATLLLAAIPATAQSQQEALDARYNRALAAGYKALFLCSAIANAERNSGAATRTPDSVHQWELAGIQAPLDEIVAGLPYRITRWSDGDKPIRHVTVDWADDMPPRIAFQRSGGGCSLAPIGMKAGALIHSPPPARPEMITTWHMRIPGKVTPVLEAAMSGAYGAKARTTAVSVNWGENGWDWRFAEGFTPFTPQRTWSVAKSLAATLVGANEHRGAGLVVSGDTHAASAPPLAIFNWYGGDLRDPRRDVTMDHLLRMASGRYSDTPGNRTDALYFGGSTVRETALHWPVVHQPGSVFRYANNDTLAAVAAIAHTFVEHPPAELFAKIGMQDTIAETDWQGDYVLSSQVWASTMDLIRFGQLYLNDGVLPTGERVLPEGWVRYVTTPSGPQPGGEFGYGAGFWLMNKSEGVPPDTFAAFGNRGQYVVIVPSRQVVIVRRGEDPVGARFDIAAFTRDVLAALPSG